jgi:hypothetical protein
VSQFRQRATIPHLWQEHAVEMFRTIPAAQLFVVPRSGHGVMPTETILTFLREGAAGET